MSEDYNIITVSETWLTDNNHRGGGVLLAFKKQISVELFLPASTFEIDCSFTKFKIHGFTCFLPCFYFSPKASKESYVFCFDFLDSILNNEKEFSTTFT